MLGLGAVLRAEEDNILYANDHSNEQVDDFKEIGEVSHEAT